jgi:hypothetical protein
MLSGIALKHPGGREFSFAAAGVAIGAFLVAAAQPFAPFGGDIASGALRAALFFAMGMCGIFLSAQVGLQCWTDDWSRTWRAAFASALGVTAFVIISDNFVFRNTLSPSYARFLHQPLEIRLDFFAVRAYTENIVYRLFAVPLLVLAFGRLWHKQDGSPADGVFWTAILLAQVVNIGWNVLHFGPVSSFGLGYDSIRYVLPGLVWGYLFWRYGFVTAEIAHILTHLLLQPAFSIFYR